MDTAASERAAASGSKKVSTCMNARPVVCNRGGTRATASCGSEPPDSTNAACKREMLHSRAESTMENATTLFRPAMVTGPL